MVVVSIDKGPSRGRVLLLNDQEMNMTDRPAKLN